ncbi:ATPase AAA [Mucor ambiguus]|uniref:ATPase AAA n=1 Tax=Mucor ambiguus TaxID=91626 RepID=A0A0C9N0Z0_9FUNG|nr:ATPase AAA [Mucor ambiguus]
MGYQRATHCEIATAVTIGIHSKDVMYKQSIQRRLWGRLLTQGDRCQWSLHGRTITIHIHQLVGSTACMKVARDTTHFEFAVMRSSTCQLSRADENDIYMTSLTDMMRSSFDNSEAYRTLGIPVAKSILIHGVSGVGKTCLVQYASDKLASIVYQISIHDLLAFNDDEFNVPEFINYNPFTLLLEKAKSSAPSTVIIRHLDALLVGDKTNKILDVISKGLDSIEDATPVCIVGLARNLRALPEPLRKTDIFRQHMTLPIPSLPQRKALLHTFLKDVDLKPTNDTTIHLLDYYVTQISMRTSGYVARDLKLLVRQARLKAMRSNRQDMDIADQLEQLSLLSSFKNPIAWSDFEYALDTFRPSQRAEVESTLPKRDWDDMGGYSTIKDRMKQAILLPLLQPHVFTKLGIKPPSGLLLYGPSGCGKTALVQALVSESMMNVIAIKGPEIFSKYLGETENKLRKLFATAKRIAPCIVFIDEMDAIGTKRGFDLGDSGSGGVNERVLSTLLNEMDGVEGRQGVVVIGCTNRPDQIDDAILRPGRLDQLVYVGLPSLEDRMDIIKTLLKKISTQGIDINALASQTEFCSGADLENLFREAGTAALRKNLNARYITPDDVAAVIIPICERAEDQVLEGRLDVYEKFLHDHSL